MEEKAKTSGNKQIEVDEGFIYFSKNGIIDVERAPRYGSVKVEFVDGKPTMVKTKVMRKT